MKSKFAVISLHLQNEIVHPDGEIARRGNAEQVAQRKVLTNARHVMRLARDNGVPVIHVGTAYLRDDPRDRSVAPIFNAGRSHEALLQGGWGAAFHDEVAPEPGDAVVYHRGIGLFHGTDIDTLLKAHEVGSVLLFGVATRLVVEAAVFDSTDRGFGTYVVEDCCASARPELHNGAIDVLRLFAGIVGTNDIARLIGASAASRRAIGGAVTSQA